MTSWLILQVIWDLKSASYALAIITIVLVNDHINFLNKQKWIKLNIENNRKKMQPVWNTHCKISGDKNSDKFCHFRFQKKLFDGENKHG